MSKADIWTRGSKAYNRQAGLVVVELSQIYSSASLSWSGSQDGEAAIGRYKDGEIATLFHLEDPVDAMELRQAIKEDRLREVILQSELALIDEGLKFEKGTKAMKKRKAELEKWLAELTD